MSRQIDWLVPRSLRMKSGNFWNRYCNLPFPAPRSDISCVILISKSKYWAANELAKQKMINYRIKGLYKKTCCKAKSNFSQSFFSHWLLHKCFIFFLIKTFANFEKMIRFHWQASLHTKMEKIWKCWWKYFAKNL